MQGLGGNVEKLVGKRWGGGVEVEAREERRRHGKGWEDRNKQRRERLYELREILIYFFQAFFLALVSVKSGSKEYLG